jgi:hypothetical protein
VHTNPSLPYPIDHMGDLVTNAKKVTVSVLYWYEKLSSLLTEIFNMILKRIKKIHSFLFIGNSPSGGGWVARPRGFGSPNGRKIKFSTPSLQIQN